MPNRILKESIRTSPNLAQISDAAERLWHRLVTSVDDFGRFDGDPGVILSICFARRPNGWTVAKVTTCLQELQRDPGRESKDKPLLYLYKSGGRQYIELAKAELHITRRATKSKYPARQARTLPHANVSKCSQARANAPLNENESEIENVNVSENESESGRGSLSASSRIRQMGEECPEELRATLLGIGKAMPG